MMTIATTCLALGACMGVDAWRRMKTAERRDKPLVVGELMGGVVAFGSGALLLQLGMR